LPRTLQLSCEAPLERWAQEKTMNRAKFLLLAALAVVWAAFLTLNQPADARLTDGLAHATTALSAIRVSDDAMALAGLVLVVCSNSGACVR